MIDLLFFIINAIYNSNVTIKIIIIQLIADRNYNSMNLILMVFLNSNVKLF